MNRPPRLAELLMRVLLPRAPFEAIAGDLEEAFHAGTLSRTSYCRLALSSIAHYHVDRLRPDSREPVSPANERRGDGSMRSLLQDLGYGFRLLRRSPGFALAAVVTLALGIGANTAIFSLVNVLLLKPLPYRDPSRVAFVLAWDLERHENRFNMSIADVLDLDRRSQSLADVAVYSYWSANLTGGDLPERAQGYLVTGNTFNLLGVQALLGRTLGPEDAEPGPGDAVVIAYGLWQRRFGSDRSVIGRQVQVDGQRRTIVGVMPRDFEFPVFNFKGDLWAPRRIDAVAALADRRAAGRATAVARLAPGVSYAQAQAELDTIMRQLESEHPQTNRSVGARVMPMRSLGDEQARPAMLIVVATVAIVLLLACANVANLLLTRGAARHRELAVRAALGASRRRIVRQLLVENLLLASGGAVVGTALALAALEALRASLPELVLSTVPNIGTLGIDRTTLGFTLVLSLVTSLIFGVVPALRGSRLFLQDGLKESASAGGSAGSRRLRNALVVAEVALATTLLAGAGLLVRSYRNLEHVSPGFNPHGVVTMTTTLPQYRYGDAGRVRQFFEDALGRVEQVPSVEQAAFVNALPFSTYDRGSRFLIDGAPQPEPGREPAAGYRSITPGYFATLEMPIVTGRAFDAADREGAQPVAIVNQEFARRHFASGAPLGRRLRIAGDGTPWMTIVGVVADVQHSQLTSRPDPELYVPFAQAPLPMMMLAARVSGEPASSISAVRSAIQSVDASQPVYHVKTLDTLVSDSIGAQTMAASLVTLFSVLALVLAAVGIYSVVAHAVSHHTKEFGVRMALGATQGSVVRLVLGRGLLLVGAGVVVGVCCAAAVTRLMAGTLYGVTAIDPLTYGTVVGLLGIVGLCACGIPAWRATRVEPVTALRAE